MSFAWPWQQVDPETGIVVSQYSEPAGPYLPPDWNSGEFGPIQPAVDVVSKTVKSIDRMVFRSNQDPTPQTQARAWWDVFGKMKDATTGAADFASSTLTKVIILVVIVGVGTLFIMSWAQAKGASFAK